MTTESDSFLRGFRSLPGELKLLILRYTVHTPTAVTACAWLDNCDLHYLCYPQDYFERDVFRYGTHETRRLLKKTVIPLLSVPEIKHLVLEAFYGVNRTVMLSNTTPSSNMDICYCPPPVVRPLVRRLEINLNYNKPHHIKLLREISDGSTFPNLHYLTVNLDPESLFLDNQEDNRPRSYFGAYFQRPGPIHFPTRHLTIISIIPGEGDVDIDAVESLYCEQLDLKSNGIREERWQRFYIFDDKDIEERTEYVTERSKFVAGIAHEYNYQYQHRVTIKTVSTRPKDSPYGHHRWADYPVRK